MHFRVFAGAVAYAVSRIGSMQAYGIRFLAGLYPTADSTIYTADSTQLTADAYLVAGDDALFTGNAADVVLGKLDAQRGRRSLRTD